MPPEYLCRGQQQLNNAAALIANLSPEKVWRVNICAYKARRSTDQNSRAWALYTAVAKENGHSPNEMHEMFKIKFGDRKSVMAGGEEFIVYFTRDTDVAWFSDYLDRCEAWAAQELGVVLG